MTAYDILEMLGLEHAIDHDNLSDEEQERLDQDIEVHFQPSYPLKGRIENVRMLDGKPVVAISDGGGYGSSEAWEEE
tara:strand:- start:3355 stop:3585 length:231 start_codon:yes stop_codon:yes gene_type:complete